MVLLALGGVAHAEKVETLRSYWNPAHTAILSDVVVEHDDGSVEGQQVLGGVVDGIGMVQIPLYGSALSVDYVRTNNKFGSKLHWSGSCIFITVDSGGTTQIPFDGEMKAIQAAMDTWNTSPTCSYERFMMQTPEPLEVGYDGKNTIKFRENQWCRPEFCNDPNKVYKPGATAITTLFFVERDGAPDDGTILDADTEVNAVNFRIAVGCETQCLTMGTHGVIEDLQNTMTHELGHTLGLSHTCDDAHVPYSPATAPLDQNGQPIPCCNSQCGTAGLPASVTGATMYNFQFAMEISKRMLSQDDIDGVCAIYPAASDPHVCAPVQISADGGCSVGGEGRVPGGLVALAMAALLALVARGRACSRSRRR
jgi:hypothetical protein